MPELRSDTERTAPDGSSNGVPPAGVQITAERPDEDAPAAERRRVSRRALLICAAVTVALVLSATGAYVAHARQYVTTDNAQVDGHQIQINAPATGTLIRWQATQGTRVRNNQAVGRIEIQGSGAQPQKIIRAPSDGTVAQENAYEGQWVTTGQNLATAYDRDDVYVTARVDETDVNDVHIGAPVGIDVDAYPGVPVTGAVAEIQDSSAGVFSLFPESNSSGNFQKITQVIPVKIVFTNTSGVPLAPGMNVTVHIHKHD
jgi:multidrug resistance efflux pump